MLLTTSLDFYFCRGKFKIFPIFVIPGRPFSNILFPFCNPFYRPRSECFYYIDPCFENTRHREGLITKIQRSKHENGAIKEPYVSARSLSRPCYVYGLV